MNEKFSDFMRSKGKEDVMLDVAKEAVEMQKKRKTVLDDIKRKYGEAIKKLGSK